MATQERFTIGGATITAPPGWREVNREHERVVLRSQDDRQEATLSSVHFGTKTSFEEFKRICALRIDAEKRFLAGFVDSDGPFRNGESFMMFFSGGEKETLRAFFGCLSLANQELITVYVEAVGVAPVEMQESFRILATDLMRRGGSPAVDSSR